jgi:preprotein translocase subunit SecE
MAQPAKKISMNTNVGRDLIEELKKVTWPTRHDTIRLTTIVIVISLLIGLYIGIIDIFLAKGLELLTR